MENSIRINISLVFPTNNSVKFFGYLKYVLSNSKINSDQYQFNKYLSTFIKREKLNVKIISCDFTPSGLSFYSKRQFFFDYPSKLYII